MSCASRPLPLAAATAPRRAAGGQRSREPPHALAQLALGEPGEPHAERGAGATVEREGARRLERGPVLQSSRRPAVDVDAGGGSAPAPCRLPVR